MISFLSIIDELTHVCLPRLCPACRRALHRGEDAMCTACLLELPRLAHIPGVVPALHQALSNGPALPGLEAVWFRYDPAGDFARLVRSAKYENRPRQGRLMGRAFARELLADTAVALDRVDVLLPVPMHWVKQIGRGYNQSREIARGISDITGIPVGDNLVAVEAHRTQTKRSRRSRLVNVQGTIECVRPDELAGLDICLVDDIVTTGATITECVMAIGRSGARPASIGAFALGAP